MKGAIIATCIALAAAAPSAEPTWDQWKKGGDVKVDIGIGGGSKDVGPNAFPFSFTSVYSVVAKPEEVINGTTSTPGEPGAVGYFNFGINSDLEAICYNITLVGVTGGYQSPARTATHIHEAARGASGPPRLAFPNPIARNVTNAQGQQVPETWNGKEVRRSVGCLTAPSVTGLNVTGTTPPVDTGSASGFTLRKIELNPAGFFADTHTTKYVPGAVRGQLGA